jgi:hypothetical protein
MYYKTCKIGGSLLQCNGGILRAKNILSPLSLLAALGCCWLPSPSKFAWHRLDGKRESRNYYSYSTTDEIFEASCANAKESFFFFFFFFFFVFLLLFLPWQPQKKSQASF